MVPDTQEAFLLTDQLEISGLIGKRTEQRRKGRVDVEYLVAFVGFPEDEAAWYSSNDIRQRYEGGAELIRSYEAKLDNNDEALEEQPAFQPYTQEPYLLAGDTASQDIDFANMEPLVPKSQKNNLPRASGRVLQQSLPGPAKADQGGPSTRFKQEPDGQPAEQRRGAPEEPPETAAEHPKADAQEEEEFFDPIPPLANLPQTQAEVSEAGKAVLPGVEEISTGQNAAEPSQAAAGLTGLSFFDPFPALADAAAVGTQAEAGLSESVQPQPGGSETARPDAGEGGARLAPQGIEQPNPAGSQSQALGFRDPFPHLAQPEFPTQQQSSAATTAPTPNLDEAAATAAEQPALPQPGIIDLADERPTSALQGMRGEGKKDIAARPLKRPQKRVQHTASASDAKSQEGGRTPLNEGLPKKSPEPKSAKASLAAASQPELPDKRSKSGGSAGKKLTRAVPESLQPGFLWSPERIGTPAAGPSLPPVSKAKADRATGKSAEAAAQMRASPKPASAAAPKSSSATPPRCALEAALDAAALLQSPSAQRARRPSSNAGPPKALAQEAPPRKPVAPELPPKEGLAALLRLPGRLCSHQSWGAWNAVLQHTSKTRQAALNATKLGQANLPSKQPGPQTAQACAPARNSEPAEPGAEERPFETAPGLAPPGPVDNTREAGAGEKDLCSDAREKPNEGGSEHSDPAWKIWDDQLGLALRAKQQSARDGAVGAQTLPGNCLPVEQPGQTAPEDGPVAVSEPVRAVKRGRGVGLQTAGGRVVKRQKSDGQQAEREEPVRAGSSPETTDKGSAHGRNGRAMLRASRQSPVAKHPTWQKFDTEEEDDDEDDGPSCKDDVEEASSDEQEAGRAAAPSPVAGRTRFQLENAKAEWPPGRSKGKPAAMQNASPAASRPPAGPALTREKPSHSPPSLSEEEQLVMRTLPDLWEAASISGARYVDSGHSIDVCVAWDDGFSAWVSTAELKKQPHCLLKLVDFYESRTRKKRGSS